MIDGVALVFIGVLIGALVPFIGGWVVFDRSVHELTAEARSMRLASEELRQVAEDLARELRSRHESREPDDAPQIPSRRRAVVAAVEESISSVSIDRELAGLARSQALPQPSYFQGR